MGVKLTIKIIAQLFDVLALFLLQPSLILFLFGKQRIEIFIGALRKMIIISTDVSAASIWRFGVQDISPVIPLGGLDESKIPNERKFIRMSRQFTKFVNELEDLPISNVPKAKLKDDVINISPPLIRLAIMRPEFVDFLVTRLTDEASRSEILGGILREKGTLSQYFKSVLSAILAA